MCCHISFPISDAAFASSPSASFSPATAAEQVCVWHNVYECKCLFLDFSSLKTVYGCLGTLVSTKQPLWAVIYCACSSGDDAYPFPGWYKEHGVKTMTCFWEHPGCYTACVPWGCQGEVSNAACAQ